MKYMYDFRMILGESEADVFYLLQFYKIIDRLYLKWHATEQAFSNLSLFRRFWQDPNVGQGIPDVSAPLPRRLF